MGKLSTGNVGCALATQAASATLEVVRRARKPGAPRAGWVVRTFASASLRGLFVAVSLLLAGCRKGEFRVAIIPRTTGSATWDAAHAGAQAAVGKQRVPIYWNAPTSEDDVGQQAALIDRVIDRGYSGLILAPDQPLALMSVVQRALSKGMNTVVIVSPLSLPPRSRLAYIVNDDGATGRMAAARVAQLLHRQGEVAVLGVDPQSESALAVLHSFESTLERMFPGIVIADRRAGTHNEAEARETADDVLLKHPRLGAIFTLSAVAGDGALAAAEARGLRGKLKLVGFEQSRESVAAVRDGAMDSLIAEDVYPMGQRAMELLLRYRGQAMPPLRVALQPTLLTRETIDQPGLRRFAQMNWGVTP